MIRIQRSALLPYSADKLFDLVNDVPRYPDYLEGCVGAEILAQESNTLTARLHLKRGGIRQSFATRNLLIRPDRITLTLVEGPFEHWQGEWRFQSLASDACKVSLDLSFRVSHALTHKAVEKLMENVAGDLVNAVCLRAQQLYGAPA